MIKNFLKDFWYFSPVYSSRIAIRDILRTIKFELNKFIKYISRKACQRAWPCQGCWGSSGKKKFIRLLAHNYQITYPMDTLFDH